MFQSDRMHEILKIITDHKKISIKKLENLVFLSRSTLRRDLLKLENEKKIIRHFGYVEIVHKSNTEFGYNIRLNEHSKIKKKISAIASQYILESNSIFIDSSSTCMYLHPHLINKQHEIVITNSVHLGYLLIEFPNIETFICSGKLKDTSGSILGESAINYLDNFHTDLCFISCKGIDDKGIYMASEEQAFVKKMMIKNSSKIILLCDSSKVYNKNYFKLCEFKNIDILITDKPLPSQLTESLNKALVTIVLA